MAPSTSPGPTLTVFIGQTATKPRLEKTYVRNLREYESTFGGAPTNGGLMDGSVRLFMMNGGGAALVISIGPDDVPVTLPDLLAGLDELKRTSGAALVVAPDAVRLPSDPQGPFRSSEFGQFADALLTACANQGLFAILDVWGGERATSAEGLAQVTTTFRSLVSQALDSGATYLPWVVTTEGRTLPPSGAVAGVYCRVDAARGVWRAPSNEALRGIQGLAYLMSDAEQDKIRDGKAVNALRAFPGQGLRVWGARTLDDKNAAWRDVPVRRTSTFIEQSLKFAMLQFGANDANTWAAVQTMVSDFLKGLWREGALLGATPEEAYFVECGLGTTMSEQDVLNGDLIVRVGVALVRPAEFIDLTITHRPLNA